MQRGERAHERRLPGAVRTEKTEEPGLDGERELAQRVDAAGVRLIEARDVEGRHGGTIAQAQRASLRAQLAELVDDPSMRRFEVPIVSVDRGEVQHVLVAVLSRELLA